MSKKIRSEKEDSLGTFSSTLSSEAFFNEGSRRIWTAIRGFAILCLTFRRSSQSTSRVTLGFSDQMGACTQLSPFYSGLPNFHTRGGQRDLNPCFWNHNPTLWPTKLCPPCTCLFFFFLLFTSFVLEVFEQGFQLSVKSTLANGWNPWKRRFVTIRKSTATGVRKVKGSWQFSLKEAHSIGFEPTQTGLEGRCSSNWAKNATHTPSYSLLRSFLSSFLYCFSWDTCRVIFVIKDSNGPFIQ